MIQENLDHLLLGVADLDAGIAHVEALTGVRPTLGGSHPGRGTRNALLSLGERSYLEVIGLDPAQTRYDWRFDIASLERPRLMTWAGACDDVDAAADRVRAAGRSVRGPEAGSRSRPDGTTLAWRTLWMESGSLSGGVDPIPFLIEWAPGAIHPALSAPGGCRLVDLAIEHPDPDDVSAKLRLLGVDATVNRAANIRLVASLATPKGTVVLS